MDKAMDKEVKKELLKAELASDMAGINKIVSEEFETRVNAPANLGGTAAVEVTRSSEEQRVRDKLTNVRTNHPNKMQGIGVALGHVGLFNNNTLDSKVLTSPEIIQVEQIVDAA
ncbi:MAG: hypothetical protein GKS05_09580 [Nitrospirales bacterium]|nr:hypothetical protein [Nitrospirales bacterium]